MDTTTSAGRIGEILAKLDGLKEGVDELKDGQADQRRVADEVRGRVAGMAHLPAQLADHEARLRLVEARQVTTPVEHAALAAQVDVLADRMRLLWGGLAALGLAILGLLGHLAGLFIGGPGSPTHP